MALTLVDQAEVIALKALVNHTAPQDLDLKLFTNNLTIADDDVEGDYTEASGGGYAEAELTAASWTVSTVGGVSTAAYPKVTFTFTGALDGSATIYGYYVCQRTSGKLLWSEKAGTPFTPANNGDTFDVTLNITAA